jgi:PAT family beta-lactamase induction signal transducer AmpG
LDNNKVINLSTFFCLYLARAIPSTFIMTALQVTMRQHHIGLATIGLLSLVRLPWSLKFAWAPLIDRHCVTVGDFKKLLISTELVFALAIIIVGCLDVTKNLPIIIALVLISTFCASVQNVTSDTLAVNAFSRGDHSAVTSTKSMGRYVGRILGGGFFIMFLHSYGWHVVVPLLGFFALLLVIPVTLNKHIVVREHKHRKRAGFQDLLNFFTRREVWPQVVFLVLFFAGFDGIMVMLKPWMVDMGYNMREIGLYNGVIGTSVAFVMALFAGWWVKRVGVRTARCLVATAALAVPVYFLALTFLTPSLPLVLTGIILLRAVEASAAVTLYASSMDFVREGREGTDFTVQVVIVHTSGALLAVVAGGVGQWLDYRGLCIIELALAVVTLVVTYSLSRRAK